MIYSDVEYPLRLCVELMHYCAISNNKTNEIKSSELREKLKFFFTEDEIKQAGNLLCGKTITKTDRAG
jgi:hypothetical protein